MSVLSKIIPKDRSERDYDGFSPDEIYEMGWNDLKSKMEEMDIVPVVRCKDCKYAYMTDDGYCNWCDIMADLLGLDYDDIHLPGDWFCADGEKVTES